ncbi:hypothetical protein K438DRAFT_2170871 [Mycena galopus ATCC 62051]|nr:hypothetical protein K438DRAFT_2170871 [Mycena galopus ATCC 62051]
MVSSDEARDLLASFPEAAASSAVRSIIGLRSDPTLRLAPEHRVERVPFIMRAPQPKFDGQGLCSKQHEHSRLLKTKGRWVIDYLPYLLQLLNIEPTCIGFSKGCGCTWARIRKTVHRLGLYKQKEFLRNLRVSGTEKPNRQRGSADCTESCFSMHKFGMQSGRDLSKHTIWGAPLGDSVVHLQEPTYQEGQPCTIRSTQPASNEKLVGPVPVKSGGGPGSRVLCKLRDWSFSKAAGTRGQIQLR